MIPGGTGEVGHGVGERAPANRRVDAVQLRTTKIDGPMASAPPNRRPNRLNTTQIDGQIALVPQK